MKHSIPLFLVVSLLASCTTQSGESVAPEEPNPEAVAVPSPAPTPTEVAAPPPSSDAAAVERADPADPPPDRMFVVAEGRCRNLDVSLIDGRAFLHYASQPIVEFGTDGTPTGETIDTRQPRDSSGPPWDEHLPQIERLGGHFPDHVFAEVMLYPREGQRAVFRLTAKGWRQAEPFGGAGIDRMWPWYDDSLLAYSPWVDDKGPRFGVVRGKPKGPRFGAARRKSGCTDLDVQQVLVTQHGDVVATFSCSENPSLFVTHWRVGDLAGKTRDLGIVPEHRYVDKVEAAKLTVDGADGFYLAAEAESGREHLWHGKDASWEPVELPAKTKLAAIATDPEGHLWIAGNTLARREGSEWVSIPMPTKSVTTLVGVEHGTPWAYNGSRVWRIADDVAHEIAMPPSAFFEDELLTVQGMQAAGPDDVWAVATYVVQRRGKGTPGRHYRSVLHSRPNTHPLRCGELTDGKGMKTPYQPWPTAAGEDCEQRMLLLNRRRHWDDSNSYEKIQRAVKKVDGIETVRFAEMEVGGEKYLVALASDQAVLDSIKVATKRVLKYKFPEVVCGDQAKLDAAGVVVHRELDLSDAG